MRSEGPSGSGSPGALVPTTPEFPTLSCSQQRHSEHQAERQHVLLTKTILKLLTLCHTCWSTLPSVHSGLPTRALQGQSSYHCKELRSVLFTRITGGFQYLPQNDVHHQEQLFSSKSGIYLFVKESLILQIVQHTPAKFPLHIQKMPKYILMLLYWLRICNPRVY